MADRQCAILSIAGSDPSGGAGIQADLKTFTILKVYGCAAITSLTVQNSLGVHSSNPVSPDLVYLQVKHVLDDLKVTHIKIGMLGNPEIAAAVAEALTDFSGEIVYDPVINASAGQELTSLKDISATINSLKNLPTVITPNLAELGIITKSQCRSPDMALSATEDLFPIFPRLKAAVVKGGHISEDSPMVRDYLLLRGRNPAQNAVTAEHPRIKSANTHGTGCTFSSAFAAYHLLSGNYTEAFHKSVELIDQLIDKSSQHHTGLGNGGLIHHCFVR